MNWEQLIVEKNVRPKKNALIAWISMRCAYQTVRAILDVRMGVRVVTGHVILMKSTMKIRYWFSVSSR